MTRFEILPGPAAVSLAVPTGIRQAVLEDQQVTYFSVTRYGVPRTALLEECFGACHK